ncbi:MAG: TolC family protein, partial [Vulcanimicrobiaceae bacterium]
MRPYRFFGAAIAAAALAALSAQVASARTLPAPVATPTPIPSASSPLPYPAYGRPAPSVSATKVRPGIPPRVTLAQSLAIAAASSPVLAAARANYRLAQVPVNLAKSAIFPSVTGQASITRTGGALVFGGSSFRSGQRAFVSKGISLNVRQLIYDGGKVIAEIHSAKATQSGAADTYERELQTLAYDVAQAYYSALQAERATSLAVQVVHQNEVQENLVRAQIRAGTTAPADLMTAELPTAQARVALVKAQGAELSSLAAFANVLGLDADTRIRPVDDTPADRAATLLQAPVLPYR